MYLLVHCRCIHAAELKEKVLMCESLEKTSEVTDDQEEMNNIYEQNKLVESQWLAMQRRRLSVAPCSQV